MKVVILFDLASPPPAEQNYRHFEKDMSWDNEIAVKRSLQRLGHETHLMGVFDDLDRLLEELKALKPDCIFNMVQSFRNDRNLESQMAGLFEILGIPFTGSKSLGLALCQNKVLSKQILAEQKLPTADYCVSRKERPLKKLKGLKFPAFVKAVATESSEGISKDSFVENAQDCIARVHYLHDKFKSDVLIEEFVEGRELYVSVLGNQRLQCFPLREIVFDKFPEDEPRFATYKAKWDESYRKKWGIRNRFATQLPESLEKAAFKICKKAFRALSLSGYARFDLRLSSDGHLKLLEANPNPSIADYDDFALSAKKGGLSYDELIQKILDLSH